MMSKLALILLLFLPLFSFTQNCDCESIFKWTKKTFEENDAGFEYAINQKSREAYSSHNAIFNEGVKNISTTVECAKRIQEWLSFFRKGHKDFYVINNERSKSDSTQKHESVSAIDFQEFKTYLLSKESTDYEGIWESEPYTVGVKKIDGIYKGFVMKVSSGSWKTGEVKFYINPDSSGVYYMGDYSEYPFDKIQLLEGQFLNIDEIYFFKRVHSCKRIDFPG